MFGAMNRRSPVIAVMVLLLMPACAADRLPSPDPYFAPAFAGVDAGSTGTCAVTDSGAAYCWGLNEEGALGTGGGGPHDCGGLILCSKTPRLVTGGVSLRTVSHSATHSCGLTASGSAFCWGDNDFGQIGDGSTVLRQSPVPVTGGHAFAVISAGDGHTCAIDTGGSAWCWGRGLWGVLGDGNTVDRHNPVAVAGGLKFAAISAGSMVSCGVSVGGTGHCWGLRGSGNLGVDTVTQWETCDGMDCRTAPVAIPGLPALTDITTGLAHACALAATGAAWCWGERWAGQLGAEPPFGPDCSVPCARTPVPVAGGHTFQSLSAGYFHTCGLTTSGAVLCWGGAPIGDGTRDGRMTPVTVFPTGSEDFADVSAGGRHTCAVTADRQTFCWGYNRFGQVGNGLTTDALVPVRIP